MSHADTGSSVKGTILAVDDNPDNLDLLSKMLCENGYVVRAAISGDLALEYLKHELPDIILLDIKMPGMNGYELCRRVKANEQVCDIPVVFISALGEVIDKVQAFNAGGLDYITKPFQFEEVLARVGTHISLRKMHRSLEERNQELQKEISERLRAEDELRKARDELERRVKERTAELEETNTALKVLLKRREEDKKQTEDNIICNTREMILPYLEKLKNTRLDSQQKVFLDILESNVHEIISPFVRNLSWQYSSLTPMEVQIATLLQEGRTAKQMAELLHVSINTVKFHKANLRNKLGLKKKSVNLRTFLDALKE